MTVTAIIAEYNPFHLGHKYHIEQARKLTNADIVLVIMSGNFVQRGEPAIFDKHLRSLIATKCGADVVLELPYPYSCSSAEYFASAAITILDKLGCVDYLCFGSECDDINDLKTISSLLINENDEYKNELKNALKCGETYAKARHIALMSQLKDERFNDILSSPNNILGIEYIKSLLRLNSSIKPVSIKRIVSSYHHTDENNPFYSASSIRESYLNNSFCDEDLSQISEFYKCTDLYPIYLDDFSEILSYKLIEYKHNPANIFAISQDLSDRIINNIDNYSSFTEFIKLLKTKNTNYSSISRAMWNIIFNLTNEAMDKYKSYGFADFSRVLSINENGRNIFRLINNDFKLITKMSKYESTLLLLPSYNKELFQMGIFADDLYRIMVRNKFKVTLPNEFQRRLFPII